MKQLVCIAVMTLLLPFSSYAILKTRRGSGINNKLVCAVANDDIHSVRSLLSKTRYASKGKEGWSAANAQDRLGYSLLHNVRSVAAARLLLQSHASSNGRHADDLSTPLHWAQDAGIAQALIDARARATVRDDAYRTPLHYARSAEIVRVLLQAGARVNARDCDYRTPLFLATTGAIVNALAQGGAYINARDLWSNTPLHTADNADVVDALIAHGAFINARNSDNETPFETLAQDVGRNKLALQALLKHGALMTYDRTSYSAWAHCLKQILDDDLLVACFVGDQNTVLKLLKAKPDLLDHPVYGITPMQAAISQGHLEVVQLLMVHGANADWGMVQLAFRNHMEHIARILMDYVPRALVTQAWLRQLMTRIEQQKEQAQTNTGSLASASSSVSASSTSSADSTSSRTLRMSLAPSMGMSTSSSASSSAGSTQMVAPRRGGTTYLAAFGAAQSGRKH